MTGLPGRQRWLRQRERYELPKVGLVGDPLPLCAQLYREAPRVAWHIRPLHRGCGRASWGIESGAVELRVHCPGGVILVIVGKPPRRTESAEESRREYEPPFIMDAGRIQDVTRGPFPSWAETVAVAATTTAVVPYVQAIAIELGKRTVKVAPKVYRGISCRLRFRGRGSKALVEAAEIEIIFDSVVTTVVLTKELPDEARLMLLDLDLTSDEFRGKALRWDSTAEAWLPFSLHLRRRWLRRKLSRDREVYAEPQLFLVYRPFVRDVFEYGDTPHPIVGNGFPDRVRLDISRAIIRIQYRHLWDRGGPQLTEQPWR
jgi:hypothetical protein